MKTALIIPVELGLRVFYPLYLDVNVIAGKCKRKNVKLDSFSMVRYFFYI